jgi:dCTP deaminase
MIASHPDIVAQIAAGNIFVSGITPENAAKKVSTNSIDVHLSKHILVFEGGIIDPAKDQSHLWVEKVIPEEGYVLLPNRHILAMTAEYTETHGYVPQLVGKSSVGRLGINIHVTAGFGDDGFCGHWTLEIFTAGYPVILYPNMPIGQVFYTPVSSPAGAAAYNKRTDASYCGDRSPKPSTLWKKLQNK